MKKSSTKLTLSRETLRRLEAAKLGQVNGGTPIPLSYDYCPPFFSFLTLCA